MGECFLEKGMKQPPAETAPTRLLGSPALGGSRGAPAWCPARATVFIPQAAVSVQDLGQSLFYPCSPDPIFVAVCLC